MKTKPGILLLGLLATAGAHADDRSNEQRRASTIASQIALGANPYTGAMGAMYQMQQQANAQAAAQNQQGSERTKSPQVTVPKIETVKFETTLPDVTAPADTDVFSSGSRADLGGSGDGDISGLIAAENEKITEAAQATSDFQKQIADTAILAAANSAQSKAAIEAVRAQSLMVAQQNRVTPSITSVKEPKPTPEDEAKAAAAKAEAQRLRKIKRDPIGAALAAKSVTEFLGAPATVAADSSQVPKAPGHVNTLGTSASSAAAAQVISLRP